MCCIWKLIETLLNSARHAATTLFLEVQEQLRKVNGQLWALRMKRWKEGSPGFQQMLSHWCVYICTPSNYSFCIHRLNQLWMTNLWRTKSVCSVHICIFTRVHVHVRPEKVNVENPHCSYALVIEAGSLSQIQISPIWLISLTSLPLDPLSLPAKVRIIAIWYLHLFWGSELGF